MKGPLTRRRLYLSLAPFALIVLAVSAGALFVGTAPLDVARAFALGPGSDDLEAAVFWRLRVPRVVMGLVLGGGLAGVGVVFQALLRNPLADPYVLGVSGGAALGGALGLVFAPLTALGGAGAVQAAAFAGALLATLFLWRLARGAAGASALVILLGGTVFNAFAAAAVLLLQTLVPPDRAQAVLFWLMGSLRVELLPPLALLPAVLAVLGSLAYLLLRTAPLNALSLGDLEAAAVGVDVLRLRRGLLVAACLVVGAAVSVGGLIGFVGLVVPHFLRLLTGPDHRRLAPAAVLTGGAFLVVCDAVTRALFPVLGTDLPVGVVTAGLGGPVFLYLLWRERERLS